MIKGYGFDRFSRDVLILAGALGLIGTCLFIFYAGPVLTGLSVLLIVLVLLRAFSTNIERRKQENEGYLRIVDAVSGLFSKLFGSRKPADGEVIFRYFRCPVCKQRLRAPKGKGKIRVTCSKCGSQFEKKV